MPNFSQTSTSYSAQSMLPIAGTAFAFIALLSVGLITVSGIAMSMVM
jgi:hypothetical protein